MQKAGRNSITANPEDQRLAVPLEPTLLNLPMKPLPELNLLREYPYQMKTTNQPLEATKL